MSARVFHLARIIAVTHSQRTQISMFYNIRTLSGSKWRNTKVLSRPSMIASNSFMKFASNIVSMFLKLCKKMYILVSYWSVIYNRFTTFCHVWRMFIACVCCCWCRGAPSVLASFALLRFFKCSFADWVLYHLLSMFLNNVNFGNLWVCNMWYFYYIEAYYEKCSLHAFVSTGVKVPRRSAPLMICFVF
jgi:hypothetical protein